MHRFYAAFGGCLCTAQGDGLAGVQRFYTAGYAVALSQRIAAGQHGVGAQRLRHGCRVLQGALCVLHAVLRSLLYSGLQAGKLPLTAGKLLMLALQELGSGKLIKPIIA